MRGKLAKQIRKITANPQLPPLGYKDIPGRVYVIGEDEEGNAITYTTTQRVMTNCQRLHYKRFKYNYKRMKSGLNPIL